MWGLAGTVLVTRLDSNNFTLFEALPAASTPDVSASARVTRLFLCPNQEGTPTHATAAPGDRRLQELSGPIRADLRYRSHCHRWAERLRQEQRRRRADVGAR